MSEKSRPDLGPGKTIVFHRMGLVVAQAQVNRSTNARVTERQRKLAVVRRDLERLASETQLVIEQTPPVDSLTGPAAFVELKSLRRMLEGHERRSRIIRQVLREEAANLDAGVASSIERFLIWLPQRADDLREHVRKFERQVAKDLAEDGQRLAELAQTWSATDADGLE